MESITLTRQTLYEKVWSQQASIISQEYCVTEHGLSDICNRLNVPFPEPTHWRRVNQSKKPIPVPPLPTESHGTEKVSFYLRNDILEMQEHKELLMRLLHQINAPAKPFGEINFEKIIQTTKEGLTKNWEGQYDYREKNKLISMSVSPEKSSRALRIADLLIKLLRHLGFDFIVNHGSLIALIEGESIHVDIGEKNSRVEYIDNYKSLRRDNHPNGCMYLRIGERWEKQEWKDGKIMLEDRLLDIIDKLIIRAGELKEREIQRQKNEQERQERARLREAFEERQKKELSKFKQLLFDAHRFTIANQVRAYADHIENDAKQKNCLNDEAKGDIEWARKKADWFDPTLAEQKDELLDSIDKETLKAKDDYSYGYSSFSMDTERRNNFWKPWWLK
jgi:hypothetical protein